MATRCRRCKRSFDRAGLGWLGTYLMLEAVLLLFVIGAMARGSWAGSVSGLLLAGLVLWALWRDHPAREASLCPA